MTCDALTPNQEKFLAAFAGHVRVSKAAEIAGVARTQHYAWLKESKVYAGAFELVREQASQALEDEAVRRAVDGVEKPVFYRGEVCGHVVEYSDPLLALLLKANFPDRYKDRSEVTGVQKVEVNAEAIALAEVMTPQELEELERRLRDKLAKRAQIAESSDLST